MILRRSSRIALLQDFCENFQNRYKELEHVFLEINRMIKKQNLIHATVGNTVFEIFPFFN